MTQMERETELINQLCCDNAAARDWLMRCRNYFHAVDDDLDEPDRTAEDVLRTHLSALELFTHPFFLAHAGVLRQLIVHVNISFRDCCAWEKSEVPWQRDWADHYRHFGLELMLAVGCIVGGAEHAARFSRELRIISHVCHHDRKGNVT